MADSTRLEGQIALNETEGDRDDLHRALEDLTHALVSASFRKLELMVGEEDVSLDPPSDETDRQIAADLQLTYRRARDLLEDLGDAPR